jgi:hypothetical protein
MLPPIPKKLTVGKPFQVKLVEGMARVCKAVSKANGGYLNNLKYNIYLICLTLFWLLHDSICVIS